MQFRKTCTLISDFLRVWIRPQMLANEDCQQVSERGNFFISFNYMITVEVICILLKREVAFSNSCAVKCWSCPTQSMTHCFVVARPYFFIYSFRNCFLLLFGLHLLSRRKVKLSVHITEIASRGVVVAEWSDERRDTIHLYFHDSSSGFFFWISELSRRRCIGACPWVKFQLAVKSSIDPCRRLYACGVQKVIDIAS